MIDESVKMEASSNNTVNFVEGFKSHVIPSLKTALLNPSSEQVKFWTSYFQNQVQRIFEIIWLQDLVLVCQSGRELRSSTLLIAAIFPWVTNHSSYIHSTYIKYKSIANEPTKPLSPNPLIPVERPDGGCCGELLHLSALPLCSASHRLYQLESENCLWKLSSHPAHQSTNKAFSLLFLIL